MGAIIAVLAVAFVIRPSAPTNTPAAPGIVAPAARSVVNVAGTGISNSKPFHLDGSYTVAWTATPDSDVGCFHGADLERADGELVQSNTLVNEMLNDANPASGSTQLYNLDSTNYYVHGVSGCAWTFTFTPS